ncbi:hypothetical protein ACFSC6_00590 [Rufibacter sediminis]|uniref:Transporter n=1 Tax=Rufibacter sediminis TaxID=2762756 RepID=A0ABR6VLQ9_9BACT|nr:hypothetical protein [Rufibacter sediminis]MBC3538150.1 hypothetical protein [Rufibacter sediminis]
MKKFLLSAAVCLAFYSQAYSQGCVAIRSNGMMSCSMEHLGEESVSKGWQLNVAHRYFKSFRHFKGDEEQKERLEQNTEVINWQHSLDLTLIRQFGDRWTLAVGLPLLSNKRSSLYEHGRTERHNSNSAGIGDVRITGYRWLLDPQKATKGNLQLGLGMKLPTGNYNYKDTFYNVGPDRGEEVRPVDQSIQLGDGGVGAITELNGFYALGSHFSAYGNVYYLFNPRGENGTRTFRETLSPLRANEAITSVPDQYMVRLGVSRSFSGKLQGVVASLGARMEGVPVEDVFGSSKGFRRPGYVQSVEPGLSYQMNKFNFFATVPVAFKRDRLQSVTDKEVTAQTGNYTHGDAAFSDYALNTGFSLKL